MNQYVEALAIAVPGVIVVNYFEKLASKIYRNAMKRMQQDKFPELQEVKFVILTQGAPEVNWAFLRKDCGDLVAFTIDMRSKRCRPYCAGHVSVDDGDSVTGPTIYVEATVGSESLNTAVADDMETVIAFPDYPDHKVFAYSSGRYNIDVVLIRMDVCS